MKNKKYTLIILCSFIIFIALVYGFIFFGMRGSDLWVNIVPHNTLQAEPFRENVLYYNFYEKKVNPDLCYGSEPNYTEKELFGETCKFIIYGEILDFEDYLFQEERYFYGCHTIAVKVEKSLYGGLKTHQQVKILRNWNSKEEDTMRIGDKGIFIVKDKPTKMIVKGKENIITIGNMHRDAYHGYCLKKDNPNAKELKTRRDVIVYWKKQNWLMEE